MTEQEIKNNIRYNEELIESYQSQKRAFEEQISSLECLKSKFITLQTNLEIRQDVRKRGLLGVSEKISQIKIAARYYNGMSELLNGREFVNVYNGLTDVKNMINREINKIYMDLDEVSAKINNRTQRISYWRTKLRNIQYK